MWWVSNLVANYAYSRYEVIAPTVQERIQEIQDRLFAEVAKQDAELLTLSDAEAEEAAKEFSYRTAKDLHEEWLEFYGELFSLYVDGLKTLPDPKNEACRCRKESFSYSDDWKEEIVSQAGDKYRVPTTLMASHGFASIDKRSLRAFRGFTEACDEQPRASVV